MIPCPQCQHEMGDLADYCNQCGVKLPPPAQPVDPAEKTEEHREFSIEKDNLGICGPVGHATQVVVVNAKFCAACGAKFNFV